MRVYSMHVSDVVEIPERSEDLSRPYSDVEISLARPSELHYRIACLRAKLSIPSNSKALDTPTMVERRGMRNEIRRIEGAL